MVFFIKQVVYNDGLKQFLNHTRWIAALCVCTAHLRNLLFPDAGEAGSLSLFAKSFYFLTLFGTQAVVVFFVVSGLLVGASTLIKIRQETFSAKKYAIDRATRLYTVLFPAVAGSVALQWSGITVTCSRPDSTLTIIGNMLFLQNILVEPLCNNHPLWSLGNEAFYYLAAPLVIIAVLKRYIFALFATFAIIIICFFIYDGTNQTIGFGALLWACGFMPLFIRLRISFIYPLLIFILILAASRVMSFGGEINRDLLLAVSFGLVLCAKFPDWRKMTLISIIGRNSASFSYSLYLIHMPIAQLFAFYFGQQALPAGNWTSYAIYFAALLLIIIVAKLFGVVFEQRTEAARRLIERRIIL